MSQDTVFLATSVALAATSSTNYNGKYSINNFLPVQELERADGTVIQLLDMLDSRFTKLLSRITAWTPYPYDGTEHITSISYKAYGTTTLWWLVAMYNGIIHPLEIEPGTTLKIPDMNQINDYLLSVRRKQGRVIQV